MQFAACLSFSGCLHPAEFALQSLDILLAVEHRALQLAYARLMAGIGLLIDRAAFSQRFLRGGQGIALVVQFLLQNGAAGIGTLRVQTLRHGCRCGSHGRNRIGGCHRHAAARRYRHSGGNLAGSRLGGRCGGNFGSSFGRAFASYFNCGITADFGQFDFAAAAFGAVGITARAAAAHIGMGGAGQQRQSD